MHARDRNVSRACISRKICISEVYLGFFSEMSSRDFKTHVMLSQSRRLSQATTPSAVREDMGHLRVTLSGQSALRSSDQFTLPSDRFRPIRSRFRPITLCFRSIRSRFRPITSVRSGHASVGSPRTSVRSPRTSVRSAHASSISDC